MDNIKLYSPAVTLLLWAAAIVAVGRTDTVLIVGLTFTAVAVVVAENTRHRLRAYGRNGWLGNGTDSTE